MFAQALSRRFAEAGVHYGWMIVAVACLPATVGLSHCMASVRADPVRWLACGAAAVLPVVGVAVLASDSEAWCRVLGATSLVLAATLLVLATLSGRGARRDDRH